jgi:tetratricopeptide (TPR) repeat protein
MLTVALAVLVTCAPIAGAQESAGRAKQAYSRALELERQGNAPAALSLLWEAAGLAPRDADIQLRLGEALEKIGALDAAIDAYHRAITERPTLTKAENNLILALVKAGRGPEGLERARALVARSPQDPDSYFTLGLAQSEQDIDGALASFRRTLELAPRHGLARYNLALVLKRADRLNDAVIELKRAIEIEPRADAHYLLGVIAWQQSDLDRAVDALRAALTIDPSAAGASYTLGAVLRAKRDWNGAIAALRRAITLRPDLPATHYLLAQVLQQSGKEAEARAELAEEERLRDRQGREREALVLTAAGIQQRDGGDVQGALLTFRRATAVFDTYAPAHYQIGLALQQLGQHDAAKAAFATAQRLNAGLVSPYETGRPR